MYQVLIIIKNGYFNTNSIIKMFILNVLYAFIFVY